MSVEQIKQSILELNDEERFQLAAFLSHLREKDDPEYQEKLDAANDRIASGHRVDLEQLRLIIEAINGRTA